MLYLKLCRDELETEPPAPIPFSSAAGSWRSAGNSADAPTGESRMDSIAQVELAMKRVDTVFGSLSEQVDDLCEPIRMSDWTDSDDDGPYAA